MGSKNGAELGLPYICWDHSEETTNYIWIKTSLLFREDCGRLLLYRRNGGGLHLSLCLRIIRDH